MKKATWAAYKEIKNKESYASNGMLSAYKEKEFKNEESYVSSGVLSAYKEIKI